MAGQTGSTTWRQRSGPSGATSSQGCVGLKDEDVRGGLIVRLPARTMIPQQSCVFSLQELNKDAFNHPCLVIGHSSDKRLLLCLQITSFNSTIIQNKYGPWCDPSYRERIFNEYVALKETGTLPHNELGLLKYKGRRMELQSYVHLEFPFWIEREYVEVPHFRLLENDSLLLIIHLYQKASEWLRIYGSESASRLANAEQRRKQSVSPPLSGCPIIVSCQNGQSSASRYWRVQQPGRPDFYLFDASLQQSNAGQTISSPQRQSAHLLQSWRRIDQNAPPSNAKQMAMGSNWRVRQTVA